jgi:hypothetical protein
MRGEENAEAGRRAFDPTARVTMLRIAADYYDRLAKHADDKSAPDSIMLQTVADCNCLARRAGDKSS